MTPIPNAARLIANARRITIKIGSSLLIDTTVAGIRETWLASLAADIANLWSQDKEVVAVSSGAVALGRAQLGLRRSLRLDHKQAAAAAGQPRLMHAWELAMGSVGIPTAQLLLTVEDTESRRSWLNARATMEVLLGARALPVVNENDSVATEELRYGDNDRLSARVAQMVRSDLLILLSDVDGLYTADPGKHTGAVHVGRVEAITDEIQAYAGGPLAGGIGSGGMRTKIEAARIASACGCATLIAAGGKMYPLTRLMEGERATMIAATDTPASAYKQWIAGTLTTAGALAIDEGAVRALRAGKSLLPAGIRMVEGAFDRGSCLSIIDEGKHEVARGLTRYTSAEAMVIKGCTSARIADLLGYAGSDEIVHRDDLVLV